MIFMATKDEVYQNRRKMHLTRLAKPRNYDQAFLIEAEGRDENGNPYPIPTTIRVQKNYGLYVLDQDCGHLTEDNQCAIYEDRSRPKACATVEVGSEICLRSRAAFASEIIANQSGKEAI